METDFCVHDKKPKKSSKLPTHFTDVNVRILRRSYSDTSWDLTREIEEEKLEF